MGGRGGGSSYCCSSTTRSSRMTSAVRPSLLIVVLPSLPVTPSAGNSHHSDCAKNPLHLIFTGKFHVLHPLSLHSARSLLYLAVVMVWLAMKYLLCGCLKLLAIYKKMLRKIFFPSSFNKEIILNWVMCSDFSSSGKKHDKTLWFLSFPPYYF